MNITNDKITEYINGFYQPVNSKLAELRQQAEEQRVPIILKETESLILNLVRMKKPKRILEIGTAVGYSALCFASVCEECHVITIESNLEKYHTASANIEKFGMSHRIEVRFGDGAEVLEDMYKEQCGDFDMIFIDAAKSHYRKFWDNSVKLCRPSCWVLSDNVLMKGMTVSDEYDKGGKHKTNIRNMREFVKYIHSLPYCTTSVMSAGDGLALSLINSDFSAGEL